MPRLCAFLTLLLWTCACAGGARVTPGAGAPLSRRPDATVPGEIVFAGSGGTGTIAYSQKSTGCKWSNKLAVLRLVIGLNSTLANVVTVALRAAMDETIVKGNCPALGRQSLNFRLASATVSGDSLLIVFTGTNTKIPLHVVVYGTLSGGTVGTTVAFRRTAGAPRWLSRLHQPLAPQNLAVLPGTLDFGNVGSDYAQSATVYSPNGPIAVASTSSTCIATTPNGASISPSSVSSGSAFSVIPLAAGTCTFVVTDAHSRTATLTVNVATTTIVGH